MQGIHASWHVALGHHSLIYLNVSPTSFPALRNIVLYYSSEISRPTSSEHQLCIGRQMDTIENCVSRFCCACASLFPSILVYAIIMIFNGLRAPGWMSYSTTRSFSVPIFSQELLRSLGSTRHLGWLQIEPKMFLFEFSDILRIYLTSVTAIDNLLKANHYSDSGSQQCETTEGLSDPDIVGSGVRLSTYALMLTTFVSLFIGSFHSGPSGTKELGMAILISTYTLDTRSGHMYRTDPAQVCYP
jgi:hypothetical protein